MFQKIQDDNSRRNGNNDTPLSLKLHVINLLGRCATLFYTVHNSQYYFRESATWRHAPSSNLVKSHIRLRYPSQIKMTIPIRDYLNVELTVFLNRKCKRNRKNYFENTNNFRC